MLPITGALYKVNDNDCGCAMEEKKFQPSQLCLSFSKLHLAQTAAFRLNHLTFILYIYDPVKGRLCHWRSSNYLKHNERKMKL